jgi:hypothetical protein
LYWFETWSLTLREEHILRESEKRVLRLIFGPKKEEVGGGWRRLHEELHNLYMTPNGIKMIKSRKMRWAKHVACIGETRSAYNILVGKPDGKRLLG